VHDRPADVDEQRLVHAVAEWGIDAVSLTYAPVGYGDHHWTLTGADGVPWFVTVADLRRKEGDPRSAREALDLAMRTATALDALLDVVVTPLPTPTGDVLRPL